MSKYIDLLREHQPASAKKDGKKSKKKSKKNAGALDISNQNPYRDQSTKDADTLENIGNLLEEHHETEISTNDLLIEELEKGEYSDLIKAEPFTANTNHNEPSPASNQDNPQTPEGNEYGFQISSWLKRVEQTLASMFSSVQQDEPININILNEHLSVLFDQLQTAPNTLDVLELEINKHIKNTMDTSHHADLVQKSVMMMLYNTKMGLQLKIQLQELLPHTIAAMLQHLGMATVSEYVRQKADKLNDDEMKQVKQSGQTALDYLNTHHIQHEQLISAITFSSERYDGSGAQDRTGHEIPWIARIISLLSMFEALIHFRPYRQRLLPRDAIREIVKHHKQEFDPEMLKALIESISLYPVGTYIQLNTGEIGQVVNIHIKFPLRPIVYINMDKYGHAITERKIDLKKQPNLMIQKCMYEEGIKELTESSETHA